jgi:acyl-CoA synthetase (AMP-forming)/AMP-acid ligase II
VRTASDFEHHTAGDIEHCVNLVCNYYARLGLQQVDPSLEKAPVIALLSPSSFEVILTFFALNRMGYAVLFLSTRLAADAHARLMKMTHCQHIITLAHLRHVTQEIRKELPTCENFDVVCRQDWYRQPHAEPFKREGVDPSREAKKIAWILHSSGSTGFPKPIYLTNLQCLANWRKSFNLRSLCTSPLFHSHALMELGRAFYMKASMFLSNHTLPITSGNVLSALEAAKPQMVSSVPYVLKLLAETSDGIDALARTQLVMYAGSSCPDDLGDLLVSRGINLVANYGATETGQLMTSYRDFRTDKEWAYLRLWQPVADHTLMDEIAPGVFESVGLDGLPSKGPSNSKPPYSIKNPENSFRTADLFTRHPDPTKSNYYKYLARSDDRLTLVNGEKVLPLPIEGTIRHDPLVREAVVFGIQQTMPGVLIFRAKSESAELSDAEFIDYVWPSIEAANTRAETFSTIIKELVVIKSAECEYARTDKGTIIRYFRATCRF